MFTFGSDILAGLALEHVTGPRERRWPGSPGGRAGVIMGLATGLAVAGHGGVAAVAFRGGRWAAATGGGGGRAARAPARAGRGRMARWWVGGAVGVLCGGA